MFFFFKFVHVLCSHLAVLSLFWSEHQNEWIHPCSLSVLPQQDVLCEFEFFNLLLSLDRYISTIITNQLYEVIIRLVNLKYSLTHDSWAKCPIASVLLGLRWVLHLLLGIGPFASLISCFGGCPFQPPCLPLLHSFPAGQSLFHWNSSCLMLLISFCIIWASLFHHFIGLLPVS